MTDKNSFILYTEYHEQMELLTDVQAGQLMKVMFAYAAGHEWEVNDPVVAMLWSIMKRRMDIDSEKYQKQCEAKRINGAKGGRPCKSSGEKVSKNEIVQAKETEPKGEIVNGAYENQEKPVGYFENQAKHDTCNMILIRDTETDTYDMIHDTEKEKKKNNKTKAVGGSPPKWNKYALGEWY